MDREEIIKKLGNYVTLQPIDYSKLTDEILACVNTAERIKAAKEKQITELKNRRNK